MLAIQATRAGGPEVLEAIDLPLPEPGPGQIRIRHEAIGLNFIDTYHRSGLYPIKMPAVLGQEGAGTVDAVGQGVTRFKLGDRAGYGAGPIGAYAQAHLVPENRAVHVPQGLSTQIAAAALLKGMTAEFLLRRCYPLAAGETVLVHAAAGGVGGILTQWAKALGATVIGAVGSPDKAAIARAQGCDHVIEYRRQDVAAKVKEITGGSGVRVVYDGVGAATFEASLASLGRRGMLVSFGNASGPAPAIEPARLARGGSLFLTRPTLFDYVATNEELDASAAALFHVIETGAVKIEIGQTFPLAEARLAHEALEGRRTTGQTLLIP
ncbi:MAG TPA: quinone oxidoreductase [Caulobacteraceae bacterium]|jgi:NADPH2:quinone reductase|nr:quinone oxidoreductase [Caulobacteraceae bacterium]